MQRIGRIHERVNRVLQSSLEQTRVSREKATDATLSKSTRKRDTSSCQEPGRSREEWPVPASATLVYGPSNQLGLKTLRETTLWCVCPVKHTVCVDSHPLRETATSHVPRCWHINKVELKKENPKWEMTTMSWSRRCVASPVSYTGLACP